MPVSAEKEAYAAKFNRLLDQYEKVFFVGLDNVQSQQIHNVRRDLRGKGVLLMGKNTLQRRIVMNRAEERGGAAAQLKAKFCDGGLLRGNRGLLFTNEAPATISEIVGRHKIQAPARVGALSPCDVVVPAGNTGMEPTMTAFFQALQIQTKISKGTVEIVADKKVLSPGDRVDNSIATLLAKLKISPFFYQLETQAVWDRGVVFSTADLAVTDETLETAFLTGIKNLTALSLGAGVPTAASFPHLVVDAFKDLLAISLETEYTFDEFNGKKLRDDIKSGKAAAAAAPAKAAVAAAPAKADNKKKEPEPEPEEEEDDFGMGGLF